MRAEHGNRTDISVLLMLWMRLHSGHDDDGHCLGERWGDRIKIKDNAVIDTHLE